MRENARVSTPTTTTAKMETRKEAILWGLITIYAAARILQVFPGKMPMLAVVALHVLAPAAFALVHGARVYGWRGIFVFIGICLLVGNIFENLSVLTGFPFGHYYFTDVMGPKIFQVPIFLGLAYIGMAYLSWTLAGLILDENKGPLTGIHVVTLPLLASFLMVAWDLSQEPVWATIVKTWIWRDGGAYFGVPLSNFLGWYFVAYILYQLFALYAKARATGPIWLASRYGHLAILFYAVSAAGNLVLLLPHSGPSVAVDPTAMSWRVHDITGTCALASIFMMGAFAFIAFATLCKHRASS